MASPSATFRRLEADKIIETVKALHDRIEERFPRLRPSAYLGGSAWCETYKFLLIVALGTDGRHYGSLGAKAVEFAQVAHHVRKGRYSAADFDVTFDPLQANWLLFFVSLFIGVIMLSMMGLVLAAFSLLVVRHSGFMAEGVSGVLFLFSGAIYPLEVLPKWLQPIGFAIPITYWLELMRRSLVGNVAQAFPTLARFTNLELLGILVGLSFLFGIISIYVFRRCDHLARERGLIDRTTNY